MRQIRQHPILSEFCDPLPRLIESDTDDVSRGVSRFGELLGRREQPLSVGFQINAKSARYLALRVDSRGAHVTETGKADQPDIEVIVSDQAWRGLAQGQLSPLEAMAGGQLRFRGDVVLASQVVHQLRASASSEEK